MNGWEWDGTAPAAAGCGVSDDEDRAREAAEAWLKANPQATAVLGAARLEDGTTSLSAYWARTGRARRSRRLRDGRIAWARIPVPRPGGGG
ncbi:MAG TPA: hypothetical protein VK817_05775 [Trebonia sp.]|nr:hypothetical protein [Trebonia sp.]